MATWIRYGVSFTGMGFVGSMFTGVGQPSAVTADSLTITDTASCMRVLPRAAYDFVVVTDSATSGPDTHGMAYGPGTGFVGTGMLGFAFTGMGTATSYYIEAAQDRVTITDTVANNKGYTRLVADSLTVTDTAAVNRVLPRPIAESVAITDTAADIKYLVRFATDSLTVTDTAAVDVAYLKNATDTITITDTASGHKIIDVSASDTVTITDVAGRSAVDLNRNASESLTIVEVATALRTEIRGGFDTITITDAVTFVIHVYLIPVISGATDSATITVDNLDLLLESVGSGDLLVASVGASDSL